MMQSLSRWTLIVFSLLLAISALAAEEAKEQAKTGEATEVKVTVKADDTKAAEVIQSIANQARAKILIESTVKGNVSLTLDGVTLDAALTAICKSARLEWRKVYIKEDSELLEKPDRLASTVRLMTGLGFPDIVVAQASNSRVVFHAESKKSVELGEKSAEKDLELKPVYLVTNDAAVAAKAASEEKEKKPDAVEEYASASRQIMDLFMKMTPEEREQALVEALSLMDQVGPGYMSAVMQSMMDSSPDVLREMVGRQTQMLFDMDETMRRRMLRMNMEAMRYLTPEQLKMLQEDSLAVMKEMQEEGVTPPGSQ